MKYINQLLRTFQHRYPSITSADMQTFILGCQATIDHISDNTYIIIDGDGRVECVMIANDENEVITYVENVNADAIETEDLLSYFKVYVLI